jgi:hypothetical protein
MSAQSSGSVSILPSTASLSHVSEQFEPEHHQRFAAILLQNEEVMLAKR